MLNEGSEMQEICYEDFEKNNETGARWKKIKF